MKPPPPPPPPATELEPAPAQEQAQALPDDLLEEIFLRLPPDEPDCLVRASLASKLWLGLLTGARFRGRYREFHGALPMLGFLRLAPRPLGWGLGWEQVPIPYLHSTTKFGFDIPDDGGCPLDCRHGRVLLVGVGGTGFVVWDPMTGNRMKLKLPNKYIWTRPYRFGAAMLCDCDGHACHESPFAVLFVYLQEGENEDDFIASADCVLVSEPAESSKPCSDDVHQWVQVCPDIHLDRRRCITQSPPVLAGDAIHFILGYDSIYDVQILKCDFDSCCLSLIDAPLDLIDNADLILMGLEDGSLGAAQVYGFTLYRWSRQMGSDGVASWTQLTIIDLENLLPIQNPRPPGWMETPTLVGSVEGSDIIFVTTNLGMYEINLKTRRLKNLRDSEKDFILAMEPVLPYMSFYHPKERVGPVMRQLDDV